MYDIILSSIDNYILRRVITLNKDKIAILADSGCDIPQDFLDKYEDVKLLGLKVIYGNDVYTDGIDMDPLMVYERFPENIPTTSTPSPGDIEDMLDNIKSEGYEKVIAICISSKLSGTFNTVRNVLDSYEGLDGFTLDTKNISTGSGLIAMWCMKQIEAGTDYETLIGNLKKKTADSHVYFYMDTLDYLRKGGRIGNVTGIIGEKLKLKPVITCDSNGIYKTVTMLRGSKNSIKKLTDIVRKNTDAEHIWLSVMNGNAPDKVDETKNSLREKFPEADIVADKQIVASLAVHTGPGLIGVGVLIL